jgi:hypothetical protein
MVPQFEAQTHSILRSSHFVLQVSQCIWAARMASMIVGAQVRVCINGIIIL